MAESGTATIAPRVWAHAGPCVKPSAWGFRNDSGFSSLRARERLVARAVAMHALPRAMASSIRFSRELPQHKIQAIVKTCV